MALNVDIIEAAPSNRTFRTVLSTATHAQVVVMCIPPGGEIGEEVHGDLDQVLIFVQGDGLAILDGIESAVGPGTLVHVPALTRHNFVNRGAGDLALYTIYAPPQHAPGTVHLTKADADADEADHYAGSPAVLAEA